MSAAPPLLDVQAITRRFGGLVAVSGLSFQVRPNEILGLIGPNGAGKSTTFNLISGFARPSAGRLRFQGQDVKGESPSRISRKGLARTFQHGSLLRELTVRENLRIGAIGALRGAAARQRDARTAETAAILNLAPYLDEVAGALPHGIQRLVGIGIAFATRPRLLCLDEPLTGLNQTEVAETLATFRRIRDTFGSSILLVEHNMRAVMQVCDRIVVLHHGQLLAEGPPDVVRADPAVVGAYLGKRRAD